MPDPEESISAKAGNSYGSFAKENSSTDPLAGRGLDKALVICSDW